MSVEQGNAHWELIRAAYLAMQAAIADVSAEELPRSGELDEASRDAANLALRRLHDRLWGEFKALRGQLRGDELPADVVERVLFPLCVHVDEQVGLRFATARGLDWPLLQQRVFGTTVGGERFYSQLDFFLMRRGVPGLVYEVFDFCLADGFRGRYVDDPERVANYRANLAERLDPPERQVAEEDDEEPEDVLRARRGSPRDYLWAGGVILACYLILSLVGLLGAQAIVQ